jgi:signal transduction histidine kinase/ActR/RegA family two-component response regulator
MNTQPNRDDIVAFLDEAYTSRINDLNHSIQLSRQALEQSRNINDKVLVAKSLSLLSLFCMIKGEYLESVNMANEAIVYYEELGDSKGVADAKYNVAGVYYKTDNYHLGLVYLIDCRYIYLKFNDYHNLSRVEKSLGTIYEYFGDYKSAIQSYEEAIKYAKIVGDLNLESNAYNPLSGIYLKENKIDEAISIIGQSIELKQKTGDTRGLAFAFYGRAKVYTHKGEYTAAEADFKAAMDIHEQVGEKLGMGMAYHKLGCLYIAMNRLDEAIQVLKKGIEFSTAHNIVIIKFKCNFQLYHIFKLKQNAELALHYLEKYLREKESVINAQTLQVIESYALIKQIEEAKAEKEKAELTAKKDLAESIAKVRQDFLSAVSHELRTPLNGILSIAQMLRSKVGAEEQQMLQSLQVSAERLKHIIFNILYFTDLDSGKSQLELSRLNIHQWLQRIVDRYTDDAKAKQLQLTLRDNTGTTKDDYLADEAKLTAVIDNLLSNAIKYTEQGSVQLSAEKLSETATHDTFRLRVTDSGHGLSAQQMENLFTSFQLPDSVTTKGEEGAGLGLAIVKKLIELNGGTIAVEPAPGHGTVFTVEITLAKAQSTTTEEADTVTVLQGKQCLLAEDDDINAFVLRKILSGWGVVAEWTKNGQEALDLSKQKPFDFILMDLHMPVMDGFEAAKHIRTSTTLNNGTPLFALTADITAQNRTEYATYFDAYLFKPLDFEKLQSALRGGASVGV